MPKGENTEKGKQGFQRTTKGKSAPTAAQLKSVTLTSSSEGVSEEPAYYGYEENFNEVMGKKYGLGSPPSDSIEDKFDFAGKVADKVFADTKATPVTFTLTTSDGFKRDYYEEDGIVGFSWVTIDKSDMESAAFLLGRGMGHVNRNGDVEVSISSITKDARRSQSYERNKAAAEAAAHSLRCSGIDAEAHSAVD